MNIDPHAETAKKLKPCTCGKQPSAASYWPAKKQITVIWCPRICCYPPKRAEANTVADAIRIWNEEVIG